MSELYNNVFPRLVAQEHFRANEKPARLAESGPLRNRRRPRPLRPPRPLFLPFRPAAARTVYKKSQICSNRENFRFGLEPISLVRSRLRQSIRRTSLPNRALKAERRGKLGSEPWIE